MRLTLTDTQPPATDLNYLQHTHPDRAQRYKLSFIYRLRDGSAITVFPCRES